MWTCEEESAPFSLIGLIKGICFSNEILVVRCGHIFKWTVRVFRYRDVNGVAIDCARGVRISWWWFCSLKTFPQMRTVQIVFFISVFKNFIFHGGACFWLVFIYLGFPKNTQKNPFVQLYVEGRFPRLVFDQLHSSTSPPRANDVTLVSSFWRGTDEWEKEKKGPFLSSATFAISKRKAKKYKKELI